MDFIRVTVSTMLILKCFYIGAQEKNTNPYRYEIELGTDNDFLVAHKSTDKYYTYGVNASFRWRVDRSYVLSRLFSNKTGYF